MMASVGVRPFVGIAELLRILGIAAVVGLLIVLMKRGGG